MKTQEQRKQRKNKANVSPTTSPTPKEPMLPEQPNIISSDVKHQIRIHGPGEEEVKHHCARQQNNQIPGNIIPELFSHPGGKNLQIYPVRGQLRDEYLNIDFFDEEQKTRRESEKESYHLDSPKHIKEQKDEKEEKEERNTK